MLKVFQKRGIAILQDIPRIDFVSIPDHVVLSEFMEVKVTLKTTVQGHLFREPPKLDQKKRILVFGAASPSTPRIINFVKRMQNLKDKSSISLLLCLFPLAS